MNHSSEQRRTRELVYISFSYDDDEFRNELREVLLNDIRLSASVWDDRMLPEGEDWEERIHAHVARARIMIMLVSNSYLDPQCQAWKFEIPQAIEAHKKGVLTIMWLAVRAVRVSDTPFPEIQATLPVSRPLEGLDFEARQMAYNLLRLKIREKLGIGTSGAFDVFISHNSKDKERVRELCEKLKRRGIEVWLDEEQL